MVQLKLVNLFIEKQVMLPSTLPDIESEVYVVKICFFAKISQFSSSCCEESEILNKVSGSKLSNLHFMFIVSSVPWFMRLYSVHFGECFFVFLTE